VPCNQSRNEDYCLKEEMGISKKLDDILAYCYDCNKTRTMRHSTELRAVTLVSAGSLHLAEIKLHVLLFSITN